MGQEKVNTISVMVTRSGKSGAKLAESIQQKGLACWHLPSLEIRAEEILLPVVDFQQAIFISPNAVKYSVEKSQLLTAMLPDELIAVGQGTADCLYQAGFKKVIIPAEFNSEGLLNLVQLQSVKGQQILIVKGRGGRDLIADELTKRGACCHFLEVYSRVTAQIEERSLQAFLAAGEVNIVTIASTDALTALLSNFAGDFNYRDLTLVVASQRIKEAASKYGFKQIVVAESAANSATLATIMGLIANRVQEII